MRRFLLAMAVLVLATAIAYGDGGVMLLHQDAGPFTVTVFASPQPLRTGPADISVMVQDRNSNQVLLDPEIDVALDRQSAVRLSTGKSANRLAQSAVVPFLKPGRSTLVISVYRGHDLARLSTEINVEPDRSRTSLVWFYVLLPAVVIGLFAIQQTLKMRHAQ